MPNFATKQSLVGTSGRLRVLVYNTDLVNAEELPKSLKELADPKWKGRLGWAPSNGSYLAPMSVRSDTFGEKQRPKLGSRACRQMHHRFTPRISPGQSGSRRNAPHWLGQPLLPAQT